jgi:hypothetical protein
MMDGASERFIEDERVACKVEARLALNAAAAAAVRRWMRAAASKAERRFGGPEAAFAFPTQNSGTPLAHLLSAEDAVRRKDEVQDRVQQEKRRRRGKRKSV